MFRPNRIGDHQIMDTSAAGFVIDPSDAEFVVSLSARDNMFVQTDETTLQEEASMVDFDTGSADVNYVINGTTYSFGTFVAGLAINDRPMMYNWSVKALALITTSSSSVEISAWIGRAAAATITVDDTAQTNNMRTAVLLASYSELSAGLLRLSAQGTVIDTILNGGLGGVFDTDPVGLWVSITSHIGSKVLSHLHGSISLYRYSQDIDTFDPTR